MCVCVCVELLKRSKTCTSITLALFWQYINLFRGVALTSGILHVHLFFVLVLAGKEFPYCNTILAGGPGPLCQAWSNEARHNGGCNLGRRVVYLQLHGHDEGDVQTLVMRAPSLVCVSSCCFPIRIHGTFIIMNLAQNVLSVLSKCVSCGGCPTRCHRARASTLSNPCPGDSMIGRN